ncbi:transporter substrate-binding domain-containing protein [uncultured Paraglaciecola sp.]|uniref:transporter substrate-binding domain-containing protein n=1 Tax=uncultured Paraglaciecola sp. TaxID=1765024 RepID=UPI0030DBDE19|tara:strand:- start:42167 stop:42940 length:774 start_codon:yes stop_codon:yes gene_type:complete
MSRLIFALFCFWQLPVAAEKYIVASQHFNYYPHYNFLSETDKGFIWAVLQEFSKFSGHQFTYQTLPVLRLQRELEKGSIDFVYPDNPLFNHDQTFAKGKYYSDTIARTLGGTMVKSSSLGENINTIKRLAIPLGFTPQLEWATLVEKKKIKLIPVATPLAELQLLAIGRVDAVEVDYFVSQYQLQNNPEFKQFKFDPSLPKSEVEFKLSTINKTWLIDEINHFIHSHPELIQQLKLQYGISEPELILQQLNQVKPQE